MTEIKSELIKKIHKYICTLKMKKKLLLHEQCHEKFEFEMGFLKDGC